MIFHNLLFGTLKKFFFKKKSEERKYICIHFSMFQEMIFLTGPSSNTFFTCRGLSGSLLTIRHQLISLVPYAFILTRFSLVPNSIYLCRSILKRGFLWGSKNRSPHYKTKYLTTKLIYSKQTMNYKLQWSSVTSALSHAVLGQTPLTHYCELRQCLCPKCNERSRNNYLYAR